jgi:hypothetical protein
MLRLSLLRHKGLVELQGLRIRGKEKDVVTMLLKKFPRVIQAVMVSIRNWKRPKIEEGYENRKDLEPLPRCLERHDDSRIGYLWARSLRGMIQIGVWRNNHGSLVRIF